MNSDFSSIEDSHLFEHARSLFKQKQLDASFQAYLELAKRGYGGCYVFLGWMCYEGLGTIRDELAALDWFKKAADVGSAQGRYYCARILEKLGRPEEGLVYLRMAVSQGYAPALCRLGRMYLDGKNVPVDTSQAYRLLGRSASAGNVFAKSELARALIKRTNPPLRRIEGVLRLLLAVCEGFVISLVDSRSDRIQT